MKRLLILLSLSLTCVMAAGCSNDKASSAGRSLPSASSSPHDHLSDPTEKAVADNPATKSETKYTLDAEVSKEKDGYYLKVSTNLKLSSEHYEGAPAEGEGHIHLYLNGVLVGPIKDESPYLLPEMPKGKNTIKLVLAENNHSESLGVTKELSIEV
ncbi:hypothetical protein [Cohnella caldifontis]|uniref:hypothetical protein n=1 Tax=Cohnella caldifontis TaxID=3027471 RepID=UPI0023ECE436|nr:hypothetical protein [Cohnella sp. YIM B05605]